MKKDTTLTIALPKSKLQPPPKKSEVIEALTKLRIEQLTKENKEGVAKRAELEKEAEAELRAFALSNSESLAIEADTGSYYYSREPKALSGIKVVLKIEEKQLPAELKTKIRELHKLPSHERDFRFCDVKKEITAQVNGMQPHGERVNALLADADSRKSLEKMLEVLG